MPKLYHPNSELQKNSLINSIEKYRQLWDHADRNTEIFWDELAKEKINWIKPYDKILDSSRAPFYTWFNNGKLNVSALCIDRHLEKNRNKNAIIWESESGNVRKITYNDLSNQVNKFANLLKNEFKVRKGDRIAIYMPTIPEAIFAMLACARIGAIHVIVFGGFSSEVLGDRLLDTTPKLIITADGAYRHGKPYMLKTIVDEALDSISDNFSCKVLVVAHNDQKIEYKKGRDFQYKKLIDKQSNESKPLALDSEDTLFILHTSGSTGKPKGIRHSTAGYILWAQYTSELVFDLSDEDVFWCTADLGWITGHTYGVYGPLAAGATILMYEGVPTFPDAGRWWNIIEKHKVTQLYTAPTAIRSLYKSDPESPKKYDLSSLRILGTVGEPINSSAWLWYYETVGGSRCPIVDTWWQTETGGHLISPLPWATPIKPGSATLPLPGISAEILDINGECVKKGESGFLCITKPWPSMMRSIWGDDIKFINNYFNVIKDNRKERYIYFSGDGAFYDENNYITITGRTDDVMNVSGHRVSSAEIESAIAKHKIIAEVAVVSRPDIISGESIVAFVIIKNEIDSYNKSELLTDLNKTVSKQIGPIIKIHTLIVVPGLPKTRSGKILRRILRSIAHEERAIQDLSTIEDTSIVKIIQDLFSSN